MLNEAEGDVGLILSVMSNKLQFYQNNGICQINPVVSMLVKL